MIFGRTFDSVTSHLSGRTTCRTRNIDGYWLTILFNHSMITEGLRLFPHISSVRTKVYQYDMEKVAIGLIWGFQRI